MKLQDAYVAEVGTHVGNWLEIGYVMKNSNNFYYCDVAECSASVTNTDGYSSKAEVNTGWVGTWAASNVATLNDCNQGQIWTLVTAGNNSAGGVVSYTATNVCPELTPNFGQLGRQ